MPYREKVSKELKAQVQRTYGTVCHLCGNRIGRWSEFTADHVKTVRAGGSTILSNLRPCHRSCNEFRGASPLTPMLRDACRVRYEIMHGNQGAI